MANARNIKGILFDSGDTLVRPIGGSWWPGPYFQEILSKHGLHSLDWDRMEQALQEGMEYLDNHHYILTEQEEREQFQHYYEVVLKVLGLSAPMTDLIRELADAAVDRLEFELFPETKIVLEKLRRRNLQLGVVSNTWPSLVRKYHELEIGSFFDTFIISSHFGCYKPDERIFRAAIESIGLPTENILYIDDSIEYVRVAEQLGLSVVVIDRSKKSDVNGIPSIDNLERVEDFLN